MGARALALSLILAACSGRVTRAPDDGSDPEIETSDGGARDVRVLMIVGGIYHDYVTLPGPLATRLVARGGVTVDVARDFGVLTSQLSLYDVLVVHTCIIEDPLPEQEQAIVDHVTQGHGLVVVHCGLASFRTWENWTPMAGGFAPGHDVYGTFSVVVVDPSHPITRGVPTAFDITDEPYNVDHRAPEAQVLVRIAYPVHDTSGDLRSSTEPQVWVRSWGSGRIYSQTFGHDGASQTNENFVTLLHNGILWSARRL